MSAFEPTGQVLDAMHHIEEADAGVAVSDAESIVSQCRQQVANWQREHRREDSRS